MEDQKTLQISDKFQTDRKDKLKKRNRYENEKKLLNISKIKLVHTFDIFVNNRLIFLPNMVVQNKLWSIFNSEVY